MFLLLEVWEFMEFCWLVGQEIVNMLFWDVAVLLLKWLAMNSLWDWLCRQHVWLRIVRIGVHWFLLKKKDFSFFLCGLWQFSGLFVVWRNRIVHLWICLKEKENRLQDIMLNMLLWDLHFFLLQNIETWFRWEQLQDFFFLVEAWDLLVFWIFCHILFGSEQKEHVLFFCIFGFAQLFLVSNIINRWHWDGNAFFLWHWLVLSRMLSLFFVFKEFQKFSLCFVFVLYFFTEKTLFFILYLDFSRMKNIRFHFVQIVQRLEHWSSKSGMKVQVFLCTKAKIAQRESKRLKIFVSFVQFKLLAILSSSSRG